MEIEINKTQTELTLKLNGNIDTVTSPELEMIIKQNLEGIELLTIDLKDVVYVSSAGLRVFIFTKKTVKHLKLINVTDDVRDVFEMTGFDVLLGI